jgi:hypothetical protein
VQTGVGPKGMTHKTSRENQRVVFTGGNGSVHGNTVAMGAEVQKRKTNKGVQNQTRGFQEITKYLMLGC